MKAQKGGKKAKGNQERKKPVEGARKLAKTFAFPRATNGGDENKMKNSSSVRGVGGTSESELLIYLIRVLAS
jgi:hypothetical protein